MGRKNKQRYSVLVTIETTYSLRDMWGKDEDDVRGQINDLLDDGELERVGEEVERSHKIAALDLDEPCASQPSKGSK